MFSSNTDSASDAFHVVRWRQVMNCLSIAVHEDNVKKKIGYRHPIKQNVPSMRADLRVLYRLSARFGWYHSSWDAVLRQSVVSVALRQVPAVAVVTAAFFLQQRTYIDRPSTHREVDTAVTPTMLVSNRFRRYARMNILPASRYSFDCRWVSNSLHWWYLAMFYLFMPYNIRHWKNL